MHPLNKKYFGNTANTTIKVHFNVGAGVTNGYIVKQTGTTSYQVTSNGVVAGTCQLAPVTNTALVPSGYMTILAYPVVNGVKSANAIHVAAILDSNTIRAVENGADYQWALTLPPAYSPGTDVLLHSVIETN